MDKNRYISREPAHCRDKISGAILNTDVSEIKSKRNKKKKLVKEQGYQKWLIYRS